MEKDYYNFSAQMLQQLPVGAFLSVKSADRINTMTIGWGAIGYIWQKPILLVAVRPSRYTYELIEKAGEFTVSFPATNELKKQLAIAGSKSGRDVDKFAACNLSAQTGRKVESPVIKEANIFFECKVVYKQAMNPADLDQSVKSKFYSQGDYHTLYFGEIVDCYSSK
jgi:flavin reductase (DIM6/NTAB) family NADH-FMN oxidoreductase RutF